MWAFPHCSVGCLTPKGLKGLLSSKNTKRTLQHHRNNSTVSIKPHSLIYIILYPISQYSTITWMHMNVWHTVIQCTIVLGFSSKDTRPHPNTLPIRSLPGVNFWVFHPRDLSPFLIRLTRASTSHLYFIFSHFIHFSQSSWFYLFIFFFSHNHDAMNATIPIFLNNSTISTFPNNPIKQFHTLQFPIISQINIKKNYNKNNSKGFFPNIPKQYTHIFH